MGAPPDLPMDRASLHAAYAGGVSPAAIVALVHRRLASLDDPGIFIHLIGEADARAAAMALPAFDPGRFPLWGLPVAVKDNIDVAGLPTTAGCPAFAYVPGESAPAAQLLRDAGAILIGKTNLDQFATGLVGVRTPYPVPRNAYDAARDAGARHRHRRFGPRAGGAEQHRRAEAVAWRGFHARRRAGLPHARLRFRLRAERGRCLGRVRRHRRRGRGRSVLAPDRSRCDGADPPRRRPGFGAARR
jgi:hypothetical protein